MRIAAVSIRTIRAEFNSFSEFIFGSVPIPVKGEPDPTQSDMSFGQVWVNFQSSSSGRFSLWKDVFGGFSPAGYGQRSIGFRQTRISKCVVRVGSDRLLIKSNAFSDFRKS